MKLVNIGFGNMINASRVIAIVSPESAPIKRMIQDSKEKGMLIDATHGRKTRSVILADSDHIILSYLQAEKLGERFSQGTRNDNFEEVTVDV